ncbi:MAG: hypothetical protein KAU84_02800 [Thermoplasmatales archaeon]|nr:hypothetical protein [Thermoplasmatales archaeon]
MNKKILLGSIIAAVILVLVSFTSVVGYSSVKSTPGEASPLFSIRTTRAIDEETKDFTCDYVGKGKEIKIHLPKRTYKSELVEKFVNSIKMMDDKSFDRFVDLIIEHLHDKDGFQGYTTEEIVLSLHQLKFNPTKIKRDVVESKQTKLATEALPTECVGNCFTIGSNYVICLIAIIFLFLLFIIISIIDFINSHF